MNTRNKKIVYTIIGIVAFILVTIGITYAYWLITKNQTGENLITSACLDISLTSEENDIELTNQFPLSDADGAKLTPYEFTVTNNCNTSVNYQIALETFDATDTISPSAIKVMIDSDNPVLLSTSEKLEKRIANATNSYLLKYGTLSAKDAEGSSTSHTLRLWIDEDAPISEMKKTLTSKISVTIGQGIKGPTIKDGTLAYDILSNYDGESSIVELNSSEFSKTTDMANGLFKILDDYGDSYYFRGNVEDNYIQFGTWDKGNIRYFSNGPSPEYYNTLEECEAGYNHNNFNTDCVREGIEAGTPMYWRIVRINGDGTIRLVYDGVSLNENGTIHDISIIKSDDYYSDITEYGFIEYKDAETKTVVDNWYNNQLATKYNSYLADSIFCNDTKEESYRYLDTSGQYTDDAENAVDTHIYYAGNKRMTDKRPKLTCEQDKDKYTVDPANGNGLLNYPVGIITADEVLLASLSTNSYIYNGDNYFTMTPSDYLSYYNVRGTYYCSGAQLYDSGMSHVNSITHRPVINLKADVPFTGTGTITDPYVIGE